MSAKHDLLFARRNILAQEQIGAEKTLCADIVTLATFSEGAYRRLGIEPGLIWSKFEDVIRPLPSILVQNTIAQTPSIFKRASALTISFIKQSPLDQPFAGSSFPKRLAGIKNHQNAFVAFEYCRQCLHGALLLKTEPPERGKLVVLRRKIKVSAHFYYDLMHAISNIKDDSSFHFLALLYESLAFKVNKKASYPEII